MTPLISAVVLTGGMSSRMGNDKALMDVDGIPALARILETLRAVTDDVAIVGSRPEYHQFGAPVMADIAPGLGPLGGIVTALKHMQHEAVFVAGCDMPLLSADVVGGMAQVPRAYQALVPTLNSPGGLRYEPLHAIYSTGALSIAEQQVDRGNLKMQDFLTCLDVRPLDEDWLRRFDPHLDSLVNVNRPEELRAAVERLRHRNRNTDGT